jgi:hypothetical protein
MKHDIRAGHGGVDSLLVPDVSFDEPYIGAQIIALAGREIVENSSRLTTADQQID